MTYKVIGLMSGSSLDGLDIAFVHLHEQRGQWSFELIAANCTPYTPEWIDKLKAAPTMPLQELLPLHTAYGRLTGEAVNAFIEKHSLHYAVNFIASHGHTIFHDPSQHTTFQLGDGASIAAVTGISVISDLRAMDVALGGQGAPIVPIGDRLLFPGHDYWLNLGGIANITIKQDNEFIAFDICPCNQVLNRLAARAGKEYDEGGTLAASGNIIPELLDQLNSQSYYKVAPPKSLSNDQALALGGLVLDLQNASTEDLLRTFVAHIAQMVKDAILPHNNPLVAGSLLATGGGVLNQFLIEELRAQLRDSGVEVVTPDESTIQYKEAIVMALIGALRWRGEANVLSSVTGAERDSTGGAIWSI